MSGRAKLRPANGPGANGLRGGRNVYPSGRTAIGVWLDEKGGPSGYKRGFTRPEYLTEGQLQQMGATLEKQPEFGAQLPPPQHFDRKPPCSGDMFDPKYTGLKERDWMTNTQRQYESGTTNVQESHLPRSNMPREQLVAYQQKWSSDTPASRTMRFQTENRRAGNAANKLFQTKCLRLIPGTPIILERFREQLLERHGVLALARVRYCMGSGTISCAEFRAKIGKCEVKLTPTDVNQILAFLTPSNDLNVDQFIRMVVARTDGHNPAEIKAIFSSLFGSPDARVSYEDLVSRLADEAIEVTEGLKEYLPAYAGDDASYGVQEFALLHSDAYACSGGDFLKLLPLLWIKPN